MMTASKVLSVMVGHRASLTAPEILFALRKHHRGVSAVDIVPTLEHLMSLQVIHLVHTVRESETSYCIVRMVKARRTA